MKKPKKKAYLLYKKHFTKNALKENYYEKIASSQAVGRDGIRQNAFKSKLDDEINLILKKVEDCTYKFTTYKQKLISKGPDKHPRVISISTIRDRLCLRVLNDILMQIFVEAQIKRPHVYIKAIAEILEKPCDGLTFVRMDIKDFFPSVDHDILVRQVRRKVRKPQLIHLLRGAITTPTAGIKYNGKGVPQGLSISNILSSINLNGVDQKSKERHQYFRYVDDILVICKAVEAKSVFQEIQVEIETLGLECHQLGESGKSQISPVDEGVEYLGFRITPSLISVRGSSYRRMFENLLAVFTHYKHMDDKTKNEDRLVWRLNLKITGCIYNGNRYGWLLFFSQINDRSQLSRLDRFVTEQLKQRGLGHLRPRIRKFLKGYHEVRFNLGKTSYIPNYDEFDVADMIKELSCAEGQPEAHYTSNLTEDQIRAKFKSVIERQTRVLDKDLIEVFS